MTDDLVFEIDGREVRGKPGETLIGAADRAGVYVPRLCHLPGLEPYGGCRLCTVKANGRMVTACTQPVTPGAIVENDTAELREHRRRILEMLFAEGNHYCMFCEASGRCELQALAYRHGITHPRFAYRYPEREVDALHPDVMLDRNRCVLCGRCVRSSRDRDGKSAFAFAGRGAERRIVAGSARGIVGTDVSAKDQAIESCPVGALITKRRGFDVPIGRRTYDREPIGSEIERRAKEEEPR